MEVGEEERRTCDPISRRHDELGGVASRWGEECTRPQPGPGYEMEGGGSSRRYAFVVESQPDHRQRERYQAEEDEDDDCVQERYPRSSGGRSSVGIVPRAAAARRGRHRL